MVMLGFDALPPRRGSGAKVLPTLGAGQIVSFRHGLTVQNERESGELALAEVEAALNGGVLIGVASVHSIGSNALCEVRTDGSGRSLCRIGGANEGAEIRHGIVLLKDGRHNGAAAHVLGELTEEGTLAVNSIKCLSFCQC